MKRPFLKEMSRNGALYFMALPGIVFFIVFNYLPMAGIIVAFKDFNYHLGFFHSPWIGLQNFGFFISSGAFWPITRNTLVLNGLFIVTAIVMQVGMALLLNEVLNGTFKRVTQSFMFFPYFISWILVSVLVYNIFQSDRGSLNSLLKTLHLQPVSWLSNPSYWPGILTIIYNWKWTGYGAIVYLAALSGINEELYEAAWIDGAGRWRQVRAISIPLLVPTITVLTLLAIGRIMMSDFGFIYGVIGNNSMLYATTDVIDTYVFRALRNLGDIGMAASAGLYQSVVALFLVLGSNLAARRISPEGALF
jgi:putative aldouronate transport system permease protein